MAPLLPSLPAIQDHLYPVNSSLANARPPTLSWCLHDPLPLRPLVCNKPQDESPPPSLQIIASPFYGHSPSLLPSPSLSPSPSPSPANESLSTFPSPQQENLSLCRIHVPSQSPHWLSLPQAERKGSIASLLNSDPELRELDEEENKNGYLSHFHNVPNSPSYLKVHEEKILLKRGRPRQITTSPPLTKKRRYKSAQKEKFNKLACDASDPRRFHKGLRHFSKQVCDKVAEKGTTTYNEIADELATDINLTVEGSHVYDQKNIRRRVYDALNVLMAMNIIEKDKKEIKWLGIPGCYKLSLLSQREAILLHEIEQEERNHAELTQSVAEARQSVRKKFAQHAPQMHYPSSGFAA